MEVWQNEYTKNWQEKKIHLECPAQIVGSRLTFSVLLTVPFIRRRTRRPALSTMLLLRILRWSMPAISVTVRFADALSFLFAAVFPRRSASRPALFTVMATMPSSSLWRWALASLSAPMFFPSALLLNRSRTWALTARRRRTSMSFFSSVLLARIALFQSLLLVFYFLVALLFIWAAPALFSIYKTTRPASPYLLFVVSFSA